MAHNSQLIACNYLIELSPQLGWVFIAKHEYWNQSQYNAVYNYSDLFLINTNYMQDV